MGGGGEERGKLIREKRDRLYVPQALSNGVFRGGLVSVKVSKGWFES
jgi:hypothetical protein